MITISDKHFCCGCSACAQLCSKRCITMQEDEEGFMYPHVNIEQCSNCGLCEKVCPVTNHTEPIEPLKVFAAHNRDEKELLRSSSGGIFIQLAREVLKEKGVVFGVKFDKDWNVIHSYAETEEDIKQFMGTKYVQSRIGNTYQVAKKFLNSGRIVLFSGTPCQIAGLKRFLRKDYDNLLTVDVICHGVPSPKVWRRYLEEIRHDAMQSNYQAPPFPPQCHFCESTHLKNVEIIDISFRDKRLSWKDYCFSISLAKYSVDGKKVIASLSNIHRDNTYMILFLQNFILRPSCYQCPTKGGKSWSDITIADFWGIDKILPEYDNARGVGLMMVNSKKGCEIISRVNLSMTSVSLIDGVSNNPSYYSSVSEPACRKSCFALLNTTNKSLADIIQLLNYVPYHVRIRRKLKLFLLKFVK